MRPKSLILLSLALGCGLVASLGINQVMSKGSPAAAPAQDMEAIYVCARDIQINELVTQDAIKLEQWPKSKIPPDALMKLEDVVGRRTEFKLQKSDVLRNGKLLEKGALSGRPSDLISPGFRGIAVQVDAASTAGNLLKPGDRVDVLVYVQKNQSQGIPETKTITFLQDVKVFAVNATINKTESEGTLNARTITLELLPEQCELVNMAKQLGQITLSVRSPKDNGTKTSTEGVEPGMLTKQFWEMVGARQNPPEAVPDKADEAMSKQFREAIDKLTGAGAGEPVTPPETWQTVVYRGPDATEYEFDKDGKSGKTSPEADSDASEDAPMADKE